MRAALSISSPLRPPYGHGPAYTLLDVRLRSAMPSVPGLSVNTTAKNVLGTKHREFVGRRPWVA